MWILGLNAYHGDASACLLKNGQLVAAAEEERFRRIKHWAGFPTEAIRYCLSEGNILLSEVQTVALNSNPMANFFKRLFFLMQNQTNIRFLFDRLKNQRARYSIVDELNKLVNNKKVFNGKIERVEHHLAHLASSFYFSPYEEAIVVSIDGFGDFSSCVWGIGDNSSLNIKQRVSFPHSLGVFYQALTQYLGFPHYGDEYKVMGLAPYGEPRFLNEMRNIVKLKNNGLFNLNLNYFRHHKEKINYTWTGGTPHVDALFNNELIKLLGPSRKKDEPLIQFHHDVARSAQAMYEEALFHLLNKIHKKFPTKNLALAGGCAMNSVANGKIALNTPFENIYIPSAAGDAGGAIGAAMVSWAKANPKSTRPCHVNSIQAYCGPSFSNIDIEKIIQLNQNKLDKVTYEIQYLEDELTLCQHTAHAISKGEVIGWFQGRMEWGPRALGNRSILCDARRADMKDILNLKIKRRESFRPFAPSILREYVSDWFELDDDVPFMMKVFKIKENKRKLIPAVTHVDGSGRLQTVHQDSNPRYYRLISTFMEITEIPILLNTSFNENEPVVCKPQEALDCFLRTKMDVLVLGNWFIRRNN